MTNAPDLSQPCPDADCVEDNDTLSDCCWGRGCRCEQAREDASYSEVADYLDDGDVIRYCAGHKADWIAD